MSTYVDERIVEMKFNNRDFEKNVQTSLRTLDELDRRLRLEETGKSFDNISRASSRIDLSNLTGNIQAVADRFSFLGIVGDEVIRRLTNAFFDLNQSIVSTVKSLTIDQVGVGFDKYERKVQSVQTIMNATGKTIDEVNEHLDKLNWYTDETSYSYADMVDNIGKFTSSNVELETAVTSMIGIANAAGLAGASTSDASHAMEGFSKAIAQGYMSRQNWQWIRTAHMDTTKFKDVLIQTALAEGTLTEALDGTYQTVEGNIVSIEDFETALKDGWMTTKVMNSALNEFGGTTEKIYSEYLRTGDLTSEIIARMGNSVEDLGLKAFRASQEAKTFSDAINSVKDAVSTGWMTSFETIFGNYEEAKVLWTNVANDMWDIFAAGGETRNELLQKAFTGPFDLFSDRLTEAGLSLNDFEKALAGIAKENGLDVDDLVERYGSVTEAFRNSEIASNLAKDALRSLANEVADTTKKSVTLDDKLKEIKQVTNQVIGGLYGDGNERKKALEQLGYDYEYIQGLVDKVTSENRELTLEDVKIFEKDIEAINQLTNEQREAVLALIEETGDANSAINYFFDNIQKRSGRELVYNIFGNVLSFIKQVKEVSDEAFANIFGGTDERAEVLYNLIDKIEKFTKKLELNDESVENLRKTFEGLLSVVKFLGISFERIFYILSPIKDLFNLSSGSILEFTGNIGEAITEYVKWYETSEEAAAATDNLRSKVQRIVKVIKGALRYIKRLADAYLPVIADKIKYIKDAIKQSKIGEKLQDIKDKFGGIIKYIEELDFDSINIDAGAFSEKLDNITYSVINFYNSVKNRISPYIQKLQGWIGSFGNVIQSLINKISKLRTEIKESGGIIQYLSDKFDALKTWVTEFKNNGGFGGVFDSLIQNLGPIKANLEKFISDIRTEIENIDWGDVLALSMGFALVAAVLAISKAFSEFSSLIKTGKNLLSGVTSIVSKIKNGFKTTAMQLSEAAVVFSVAIAILSGSLWLLATQTNKDELLSAATALGIVIGAFAALIAATALLSKWAPKLAMTALGILGFSAAIGILAVSIKLIQDLKFNDATPIITMIALIAALGGVGYAFSKLGIKMEGVGLYFLTFAGAILVLAIALEKVANIPTKNIKISVEALISLMVTFGIIAAMSSLIKASSLGLIGLIGAAFLLVKFLEMINDEKIKELSKKVQNNLGFLIGLFATIGSIAILSHNLGGKNSAKLGIGIALIAASLFILVEAVKKFAEIDKKDLEKGMTAITASLLLFSVLALAASHGENNGAKTGIGIAIMAASLIVVYYALKKFGELNTQEMAQGLAALIVIFGLFAVLLASAKGATDAKAILSMAAVIVAITAAIVVLSFYDWDKISAGVTSLLIVLGVLAGCMVLMSKFAENGKGVLLESLGAVLMLAVIAAAIVQLAKIGDWQAVLASAEAISLCLIAVAGAMAILDGTKVSLGEIGGIAIGLVAMALIALILNKLTGENWQGYISMATAMSEVLLAITAVMEIASAFPVNIPAMLNFAGGLGILGATILFLGWLASGVAVLMAKNFESASAHLPTIAENIKKFCSCLSEIEPVDQSIVDTFKTVGEAFLALTEANFINKILSLFTDGNPFSGMDKDFEEFGKALTILGNNLPNKQTLERIGIATKSLKDVAEATEAMPKNVKWKDLTDNLSKFGEALSSYGTKIEDLKTAKISQSVTAVKAVVEIAGMLPKSGGIIGVFTGHTDWDGISNNLAKFGNAIYNYGDVANNIDDGMASAIERSKNSVKIISDIANMLPTTDGLIPWITGTTDWDGIINNLEKFGSAIVQYGNKALTIEHEAIEASLPSVKIISEIASILTDTDSIERLSHGTIDTKVLKDELVGYAEAVKQFSISVGEIRYDNMKKYANLEIVGANSIETFINGMNGKKFDAVAAIKNIMLAIFHEADSKTIMMMPIGEKIKEQINEGLNSSNNQPSFEAYINRSIQIVKGFFGQFIDAGRYLSSGLGEGMESGSSPVFSSVNRMMSNVANTVNGYKDDMHRAAYNLMKGLAEGIDDYAGIPEKSIKKLSDKMLKNFEFHNEIKSPSHLYRREAHYIPAGVAKGVDDEAPIAIAAIEDMSDGMIVAISPIIERLGELIDGEFEFAPSIRPVVDMSDVYENAGIIGGLFANKNSEVNSKARSISQNIAAFERSRALSMASEKSNESNAQAPVINNYIYTQPGQNSEEIANEVERRMVRKFTRKMVAIGNT